jgi:hypothetical protein
LVLERLDCTITRIEELAKAQEGGSPPISGAGCTEGLIAAWREPFGVTRLTLPAAPRA